MAGVLEGVRVLDLSWGVAGPMTAMLLGDQGADPAQMSEDCPVCRCLPAPM